MKLVVQDTVKALQPDAVHMKGFVGGRLEVCRLNRLRHQEEYHLLWPFREHCPIGFGREIQRHPEIALGDWQGEFIGTWVATASIAAWNAGDEELRQKLDAVVSDWLDTQDENGYLGTYDQEDRWKSWDIWIQAHALLGLLTYHHYTGKERPLDAAIRVAERVMKDFGPGRRYLYTYPHHDMASSAILEPMIWLYWQTGEERFLEWCKWLVDESWDSPEGHALSSSLLAGSGVAGTKFPKGAEMFICLAALLELYRATGEERYLKPALIAWDDVVQRHLYITGSASADECFTKDFTLRNDGLFLVGETCVTMTWLYLNLSLWRLSGEGRFFDMVEQALYNHLLAAQSPDGRGWSYYTGLRDCKRYYWHSDPDCCPKRGSRALTQIPLHVFGLAQRGLYVNLYDSALADLSLPSGCDVHAEIKTLFPYDGKVSIKLDPVESAQFGLFLRMPAWCPKFSLNVNGQEQDVRPNAEGYLVLDREWTASDEIELMLEMPVRVVVDNLGNVGKAAVMRGPVVYAADQFCLPKGLLLDDVVLAVNGNDPSAGIRITPCEETGSVHLLARRAHVKPPLGTEVWGRGERYHEMAMPVSRSVEDLELVPFIEAGNRDPHCFREGVSGYREGLNNITYQVWLPYAVISE